MKTETKNRISELFDTGKQNLLSVYFTAGFPHLDDTIEITKALQAHGVDMIEIGIPFSDPVADGPVIQESNKIALANGMNVSLLLAQVEEIRKSTSIPIVLMGYINPIMQFGVKDFLERAAAVGVDGLIIPDLPLDEYEKDYKIIFEELGIMFALLVSPTTSTARILRIDNASSGFLYAVSSSSTTGAKKEFSGEQLAYFKQLSDLKLQNPFLVGFGISNAITFQQACQYSRGAIVGSAFVTALGENEDIDLIVSQFVAKMREA